MAVLWPSEALMLGWNPVVGCHMSVCVHLAASNLMHPPLVVGRLMVETLVGCNMSECVCRCWHRRSAETIYNNIKCNNVSKQTILKLRPKY